MAGFKNPAKTIAEGQRKLQYSFQRTFEKETGKKLRIEDYETKEARMQLFLNYADQVGNMELAREQFEEMY